MNILHYRRFLTLMIVCVLAARSIGDSSPADADEGRFQPMDVFSLEFAADPQISPDGKYVAYARSFMDVMTDKVRSNIWMVGVDGSGHRAVTTGNQNDGSHRWSPSGDRLLYVSSNDGTVQLYCRWMDTGQTAKLTNLTSTPKDLVWSPNGRFIAFSMLVENPPRPFVELPRKPKGAEWADPPKVIRRLNYRHDGGGYLKDGFHQLFVLPAEGGTPRQLTSGEFHHDSTPSWTPDSRNLIFSANRHDDWEYDPLNTDVYRVSIADRSIKSLTDRQGPDRSPVVSPDGKRVAYVGFDDQYEGYQITRLYVMNMDGSGRAVLTPGLDRSVRDPVWRADSGGVFFTFDDQGTTKIGFASLTGKTATRATNVGGTTIGRPYASGSFSVAEDGTIAFTQTTTEYPADVAVLRSNESQARRVTSLNADLLHHKALATVEEIRYASSHDGRSIQGWIAKPPGFEQKKRYPLILEIHGGPFANYGERFSAEVQLYAAAGYVVLYVNPRGSTGYGKEFGNLIHHAYPGFDFDDLMSGVDAVVQRGYIDEQNLFVTGGSGGGVLTSWVVGKTDRFRAAVAAKPVINWYSFALTSDMYAFFYKYWFPGYPWEHPEHYRQRSPLSLVGNVSTPTMIMTGEVDYRTPISESEQFYQALKLRKVETALVRIPGASHNIAGRPSRLIAKVAHVLKWFETYRK